jgi:hypothetical protein
VAEEIGRLIEHPKRKTLASNASSSAAKAGPYGDKPELFTVFAVTVDYSVTTRKVSA